MMGASHRGGVGRSREVPGGRSGPVRSGLRPAAVAALVLSSSALGATPGPLGAQSRPAPPTVTMPSVAPTVGNRGGGPLHERRVALVQDALADGVLATSREDSLAAFVVAVDTARALVEAAPRNADAHYLYAVALGQRLEFSGIREKVRLGDATRAAAEAALALSPDHAGAHHVMGRLHAGTMRLNPVARFLAKRVLGAKAMEDVSWERGEYHFTRALELEPDNPRHSLELGVLYADTDRPEEALGALRLAARAPRRTPIDSLLVERATRLIETMEGS